MSYSSVDIDSKHIEAVRAPSHGGGSCEYNVTYKTLKAGPFASVPIKMCEGPVRGHRKDVNAIRSLNPTFNAVTEVGRELTYPRHSSSSAVYAAEYFIIVGFPGLPRGAIIISVQ